MGNPRNPGIFPMAFEAGLDEKTDSRHAQSNALLLAENIRFDKEGRVVKRHGMESAAVTTSNSEDIVATAASVIIEHNGTPAVFDDRFAYKLTGSTLQSRGFVSEITGVTYAEIASSAFHQNEDIIGNPDVAEGGGYECYAWVDSYSGDIFVAIRHQASGTFVNTTRKLTSVGTITGVRVCAVVTAGVTNFWIVAADDGSNTIRGYRVDTTGALLNNTSFLANMYTALPRFDAVTINNQIYIVAMGLVNGIPTVHCRDDVGVLVANDATADADITTAKTGFAIAGATGENIVIAYSGEIAGVPYIRYRVLSMGLVVSGTYSIATERGSKITLQRVTPTSYALIFFSADQGTANDHFTSGYRITTAGVTTTTNIFTYTYWCGLASKAFSLGGRVYFWAIVGIDAFRYGEGPNPYDPGASFYAGEGEPFYREGFNGNRYAPQMSFVLMDAMIDEDPSIARPVAVHTQRSALWSHDYRFAAPSVISTGTPLESLVTASTSSLIQVGVNKTEERTAVKTAETIAVNGGMLQTFDGEACFENAFLYHPNTFPWYDVAAYTRIESYAGPGSYTPGDRYAFICQFVMMDAMGNITRSAFSRAEVITVGLGHDTIRFRAPYYCTTAFGTTTSPARSVYVDIYRTAIGALGDQSTTYHLYDRIRNDAGIPSFLYIDTNVQGGVPVIDSILEVRPVLLDEAYDTVMPPAFSVIASHRNRLYGASRNAIWYSKEFIEGESVGFADEQTIELLGENVVSMISLDDKLLIFTDSKIYALYGDGPVDTGAGVQFASPIPIANDLGCIAPRSVCLHPNGILFQSRAGIYNLSRDLQVTFIGEQITDKLTGTVLSAVVHPSENTILIAQSDTTDRLVFDYRTGRWSVDKLATLGNIVSQCIVGGSYYALANDTGGATTMLAKESATYLDLGAWMTMRIQFGWTKLGEGAFLGVQQSRKVHGLFEKFTNAGLTLSLYTSFSTTADVTNTWTSTEINALSDLPVFKLSQAFTNARSTAATLEISDIVPVASTGTGQGCAFLGVAYDIEGFAGETRKPAENKG